MMLSVGNPMAFKFLEFQFQLYLVILLLKFKHILDNTERNQQDTRQRKHNHVFKIDNRHDKKDKRKQYQKGTGHII
jgi:hypothetical protein